jgi:hypothetical protein
MKQGSESGDSYGRGRRNSAGSTLDVLENDDEKAFGLVVTRVENQPKSS